MVTIKPKTLVESAERKYDDLIAQRDAFNAQARVVMDELDAIYDRRAELVGQIRELKQKRGEAVEKMRLHRARRDTLHEAAGQYRAQKRERAKDGVRDVFREIEAAKAELQMMELKQQTTPLTLAQENELLDGMRSKREHLRLLEEKGKKQTKLDSDLTVINKSIEELSKEADVEHQSYVRLKEESDGYHGRIVALSDEVDRLIADAKKKKDKLAKFKEQSDAFHRKAKDMLAKIIQIRQEARAEREEEHMVTLQHNVEVRKRLEDEKETDKAVDEALQELLKKGKFSTMR